MPNHAPRIRAAIQDFLVALTNAIPLLAEVLEEHFVVAPTVGEDRVGWHGGVVGELLEGERSGVDESHLARSRCSVDVAGVRVSRMKWPIARAFTIRRLFLKSCPASWREMQLRQGELHLQPP